MCFILQIFQSRLEAENKEINEENTRLECDKEMLQSLNTQLIKEKHQLETSVLQLETRVMQVQAENNQQKTENNQLKSQIAAERIQLESHHKEKLHLESRHQREKQLLQPQVERLTKELERITTVSIEKKSLVSYLFFNSISQVQSPLNHIQACS